MWTSPLLERLFAPEPLVVDAIGVLWILVSRNAGAKIARALEIAEGGATPGIDQRLDGGVRVLQASD